MLLQLWYSVVEKETEQTIYTECVASTGQLVLHYAIQPTNKAGEDPLRRDTTLCYTQMLWSHGLLVERYFRFRKSAKYPSTLHGDRSYHILLYGIFEVTAFASFNNLMASTTHQNGRPSWSWHIIHEPPAKGFTPTNADLSEIAILSGVALVPAKWASAIRVRVLEYIYTQSLGGLISQPFHDTKLWTTTIAAAARLTKTGGSPPGAN